MNFKRSSRIFSQSRTENFGNKIPVIIYYSFFFLQVRRSKIHLRCPLENLPQNLSLSNSFERPSGFYSRNSGMKRICFNIFIENPVSQQGDCLTVVKVPSFSIFFKENSPKICFIDKLFFGSEMNLIHINICSLLLLNSI